MVVEFVDIVTQPAAAGKKQGCFQFVSKERLLFAEKKAARLRIALVICFRVGPRAIRYFACSNAQVQTQAYELGSSRKQ